MLLPPFPLLQHFSSSSQSCCGTVNISKGWLALCWRHSRSRMCETLFYWWEDEQGGGGEGILCHTCCPWGQSGSFGFGRKEEGGSEEEGNVSVCVRRGGCWGQRLVPRWHHRTVIPFSVEQSRAVPAAVSCWAILHSALRVQRTAVGVIHFNFIYSFVHLPPITCPLVLIVSELTFAPRLNMKTVSKWIQWTHEVTNTVVR